MAKERPILREVLFEATGPDGVVYGLGACPDGRYALLVDGTVGEARWASAELDGCVDEFCRLAGLEAEDGAWRTEDDGDWAGERR